MTRKEILLMSDEELGKLCEISFFKSSGNGGQKRNKCSTAVRVKLTIDRMSFVAEDCTERSQHQNRRNAFKKLKREIAYKWREIDELPTTLVHKSSSNSEYYLNVAAILDLISYCKYDLKSAAEMLGVSHSKLDKELRLDPHLYQYISQIAKKSTVDNS
ncbi:MAG: peptide chain release factor-like protein [Lentisphaeria bacterium]|nr:peptide chain release factor-like protein [Lentisphaeria bacterium]